MTVKATDFAQATCGPRWSASAASPSRCGGAGRDLFARSDSAPGYHRGSPPLVFPEPVQQCIDEHKRAFGELFDVCVPIDITKPEDGFANPNFGGDQLKQTLLDVLPAAYRQTLMRLKEATDKLKSAHLRHAIPIIIGYTSMAGTAGAIPFPFVDLVLLPSIQARMANHLAGIYGQPMTNERLKELGAAVGVGLVARSVVRQAVKFIPFVGSAVGATVAAASTYALAPRARATTLKRCARATSPRPTRCGSSITTSTKRPKSNGRPTTQRTRRRDKATHGLTPSLQEGKRRFGFWLHYPFRNLPSNSGSPSLQGGVEGGFFKHSHWYTS